MVTQSLDVESVVKVSLPNLEVSNTQAKIHGRLVITKIVGCSFEHRQETISKLREGDRLWLERQPDNPFDFWAVKVFRSNAEEIGFLNRYLAKAISPYLDAIGHPIKGRVYRLTGSSSDGYLLGAMIAFKIPSQAQIRKSQQQKLDWDWED